MYSVATSAKASITPNASSVARVLEITNSCMEAIEKDDPDQLKYILANFTNDILKITHLVNNEGFSLLHRCV